MSRGILLIVEHDEGYLKGVSEDILSFFARIKLKEKVSIKSISWGDTDISLLIREMKEWGASETLILNCKEKDWHNPYSILPVLTDLIKKEAPRLIVFGYTSFGKDVAPRLAQLLQAQLVQDILSLSFQDKVIRITRSLHGGKVIENLSYSERPLIVTVRPNVLGKSKSPVGKINVTTLAISPKEDLSYVLQDFVVTNQRKDRVPLLEAEVIIAGGRGVRNKAGFDLLEELAAILGGSVGATRAAVDNRLRPYADQIGQAGITVSPKLYFACGIHGAIQHVAGMSTSQVVVAINKDPEAPIFKAADYGVIGDLYEILPVLIKGLKEVLKL